VFITGVYQKQNENFAVLYDDQQSMYLQKDIRIPLLIDEDTTRVLRKYLLERCDEHRFTNCRLTILGQVTTCEYAKFMNSSQISCLKVDDGIFLDGDEWPRIPS
jgi:hypothetical protein